MVVSYNRIALLHQCLGALLRQTQTDLDILVVDNASTQEGYESLADEYKGVRFLRQEKNIGGAGGFHVGLKEARQGDYDFYWVMDDDVIPSPDALSCLLRAFGISQFSYACSLVYSRSGKIMNVPNVKTMSSGFYPDWAEYLPDRLVKVTNATFVSVIIPKASIDRYGLPIYDMFIWGDDTEYTLRLTQDEEAVLVGSSTVVHAREIDEPINIRSEKLGSRIHLYYFYYRNNLYINRTYFKWTRAAKFTVQAISDAVAVLAKRDGIRKSLVVVRGVLDGWKYSPGPAQPVGNGVGVKG
ncbi:glycosyltransferase [Deinococcus apachensis]|uniref:glycosyltransferase n=1 Tax=Deinococcus apachensis TaxID=309886 RepID=UPI00146B8A6B|nr:glycosyltransferase [Deinococcus apachensis]